MYISSLFPNFVHCSIFKDLFLCLFRFRFFRSRASNRFSRFCFVHRFSQCLAIISLAFNFVKYFFKLFLLFFKKFLKPLASALFSLRACLFYHSSFPLSRAFFNFFVFFSISLKNYFCIYLYYVHRRYLYE